MRHCRRETRRGSRCPCFRPARGPGRPAHYSAGLPPAGDRTMKTILRLLIVALAALAAPAAWAHTQSYSFLSLTLGETSADGRLELAVRDLDRLYDLDVDRDGAITWGEFRR